MIPISQHVLLYGLDSNGVPTPLLVESDGSIAGGGSGGAPTDAQYVVGAAHASLSAELVLGTQVIMSGTLAARPAASLAGLLYFATDVNRLYRDSGSSWVSIGYEDYIVIVDQKAQNTQGGTFTSGAWRTRDLNTELVDTGNFASVASNQITLEAGTYKARVSAPALRVDTHQVRLQNITDGATLIGPGYAIYTGALGDYAVTRSEAVGRFTIAAQKVIELQHICLTTRATNGYGNAGNLAAEIYGVVELWKEA